MITSIIQPGIFEKDIPIPYFESQKPYYKNLFTTPLWKFSKEKIGVSCLKINTADAQTVPIRAKERKAL